MKVDVNQKLKGIDGNPLKNGKEDITLQDILIASALTDLDKEGKDKIKDFNIFMKVKPKLKKGVELELTNDDCVRLQEKLKLTHSTIVFGQVNEILEGKPNPMG